jgi:hypothetical protein
MPPSKSKDANPARRGGKAWKQRPGVSASAATGRTVGGFSPAAVQRRTAKRTSKQAA